MIAHALTPSASGIWRLNCEIIAASEAVVAKELEWRASKTDEEIVELGRVSDEKYKMIVKREFGLDVTL